MPPVSFSWPTRASDVPSLKLVPFQKLELGCGSYATVQCDVTQYPTAPFKGVHLNTSFSYGIDDQDFVVAFDSDYPQEFVDLVGRLRYTEASLYTQRDTPMFTCAKAPIDAILAQLANVGA